VIRAGSTRPGEVAAGGDLLVTNLVTLIAAFVVIRVGLAWFHLGSQISRRSPLGSSGHTHPGQSKPPSDHVGRGGAQARECDADRPTPLGN
jgi:hypothetical protein